MGPGKLIPFDWPKCRGNRHVLNKTFPPHKKPNKICASQSNAPKTFTVFHFPMKKSAKCMELEYFNYSDLICKHKCFRKEHFRLQSMCIFFKYSRSSVSILSVFVFTHGNLHYFCLIKECEIHLPAVRGKN